MTKKTDIGKRGEDAAFEFLKGKGYKIISRNYRQKWGEIDIIAISPGKFLVIVEVKTVMGIDPMFSAEDQMTKAKIKKTQRMASLYANSNEKISQNGWQIDLIAVKIVGEEFHVKHYENI